MCAPGGLQKVLDRMKITRPNLRSCIPGAIARTLRVSLTAARSPIKRDGRPTGRALRLDGKRKRRGDARTAGTRAVDLEPPPERRHAVHHPDQAVAARIRATDAVVGDLDSEGAVGDGRSDRGPLGVRVLHD